MFCVTKIHYVTSYGYGVRSYLADYVSDISNLPTYEKKGEQNGSNNDKFNNQKCMPGSVCRVAEDSSVWILNNQNEWIQQEDSAGSDSESDISLTAITTDEIDTMFG